VTDSAATTDFVAEPSAWDHVPPSTTRTPALGHRVSKCSSYPITEAHDGDAENLPSEGCCPRALPYSGSSAHGHGSSKLHWQSCLSTEGREGDETHASGCSGGANAGSDRKALVTGT
jgi:hypothetical protein